MKMTEDAMRRCSSLLIDFANRKGFRVVIDHEIGEGQTKIRFERYPSSSKNYWLEWNQMNSVSEGCAYILADLIRAWDLDLKIACGANHDTKGEMNRDSEDTIFKIKNVIFNDPATIVLWEDGTKTVVKCQDSDEYSEELGLAMCIAKKALGNKGNFNEVFKKWLPVESAYPTVLISTSSGMTEEFQKRLMEKLDKLLNDTTFKKRGMIEL